MKLIKFNQSISLKCVFFQELSSDINSDIKWQNPNQNPNKKSVNVLYHRKQRKMKRNLASLLSTFINYVGYQHVSYATKMSWIRLIRENYVPQNLPVTGVSWVVP